MLSAQAGALNKAWPPKGHELKYKVGLKKERTGRMESLEVRAQGGAEELKEDGCDQRVWSKGERKAENNRGGPQEPYEAPLFSHHF